MTKRHTFFVIFTALAISGVISIVGAANAIKGERTRADQIEVSSEIETQAAVGYYLKEYEGNLAVFRGDSKTPYKKLDVDTQIMTDEDRETLRKGIYAQTEAELKSLIEDFSS